MGFLNSAGKFLFGDDPGRDSRRALEKFGLSGQLGGQDQSSLLNSIIGSRPSEARAAVGQRFARSGLTGSGFEESAIGKVGIETANELRQARLGLIRSRLSALGVTASQPARPGFLQAAIPLATQIASGKPPTP